MDIKLAVIIPTYDNLEMLKPMLSYLDGFNIYVIEDGVNQETINWLKKQKKVKTIFHRENEGVAISWNDGLKEALKDGCTHFAIINDDVVLPKNWWNDCKKLFKDNVHLVCLKTQCLLSGWFFIIDKECVDKVGFFDTTHIPYGGEDTDYILRYNKLEFEKGITDIDTWHYGSKTVSKLKS